LVSAAAGNKSATRPPLPPPRCGGEWKETDRKLVGRDKSSLTEQQTEGTVTTTIQKRRIAQNKPHDPTEPLSRTGPAPHAPEPRERSRRTAPHTGTQRDVTWYGILGSLWPGGVSPHPPLCPFLESGEN